MPPIDIRRSEIAGYVRYEPRVISRDFKTTVKATVHDALWMLTQQFRIGEFNGDDAGSIIKARVVSQSKKINRFKGKNGSVHKLDESIPLESQIEKLPLIMDFGMSIELGNIWLKLIRKTYPSDVSDLYSAFKAEFPIDPLNNDNAEQMSNAEVVKIRTLLTSKSIDGVKLLKYFKDGGDVNLIISGYPLLINMQNKFITWVENTYYQPENVSDNSWSDQQLEYQCSISSPIDNSISSDQNVLVADKYQRGNLDWYSFDLHDDPDFKLEEEIDPIDNASAIQPKNINTYIPQKIHFKGMPNERWWEFEDRNNDLARMLTQKQDIVKMVVMEFGLIYSNDWFVIPHRISDNTLTAIDSLVTTDVFGRQFLVNRAGSGIENEWQRWDIYNNSRKKSNEIHSFGNLLMVPRIKTKLESAPIEKVLFLRDEMANMVWGVEEVIPNELFSGVDGKNANNELMKYLSSNYESEATDDGFIDNNAAFRYRISNSIPENWIPFIPVQVDAILNNSRKVMLQRASFNRYINDEYTNEIVRPRTAILSVGLVSDPVEGYFINEEEVSRSGFIVSTHFQRTRWYDGKPFVWVGRKVNSGRGEGNSGLKYDIIQDKESDL